MPPSQIGKYEVQRRLGTGGMGSLYLARDPGLERLVAIKLLKEEYEDDPELRERFRREARSVARLRHPNIITVFDVSEEGGRPFIVMEYLAGDTLKTILGLRPPIPLTDRLGLAEDILAGLAHAHSNGIIHRDIKPANIMLDGDGVLKILDFGIARLGNSGMTQDGAMLGTVNYMSPEQVVGRGVDHTTDIFAAGAVLYELIALQQAFPGRIDEGVLNQILHGSAVPLESRVAGIDRELARIVARALERDRSRRYQDAHAMLRDLSRARQRLLQTGQVGGDAAANGLDPPPSPTPAPGQEISARDSDRPRRVDAERFAELRRRQVEEHLRLGEEALAHGEAQSAFEHAERAATIDPDSRTAYDLIDRATFAIQADGVRQRLSTVQRLLSHSQIDEASKLVDEVRRIALPDVPGAADLRAQIEGAAAEVESSLQRRQRIAQSLERARAAMDHAGYDTALRSVYEVLALDPEQPEARRIEQDAKAQLQAQRELARATEEALARLEKGRLLAADRQYDAAIAVMQAIEAPTEPVRLAVQGAVAEVRQAQRAAACEAVVERARKAFAAARYSEALTRLDSLPRDYVTDDVTALRRAVESAQRAQRELEARQLKLDAMLVVVSELAAEGDFSSALDGLDDAAKLGLDDSRIPALRQDVELRRATALERQRQEARDRAASTLAQEAGQRLASGDRHGARALLEGGDVDHPLIQEALGNVRRAIAAEDERLRLDAERRRQEEEARIREADRQRQEEEARREAERRRRDEEARIRREAERQQQEEEARREAERQHQEDARRQAEAQQREQERQAEDQRRRDHVVAALAAVEQALTGGHFEDAERLLTDPAVNGAIDSELARRRETLRAQVGDARAQQEVRLRAQQEGREREEALTRILTRANKTTDAAVALDVLQEALTLAPDDERVTTIIAQRSAALEQEHAAEQKRRDEARQQEEGRRRQEVRRREEEARTQADVERHDGRSDTAPSSAADGVEIAPAVTGAPPQPLETIATIRHLARDRRVQAAAAVVLLLLTWGTWRWAVDRPESGGGDVAVNDPTPDISSPVPPPATTPQPGPVSPPGGTSAPSPSAAPAPAPDVQGRPAGAPRPAPAPPDDARSETSPRSPSPAPSPAPPPGPSAAVGTPAPSPQPETEGPGPARGSTQPQPTPGPAPTPVPAPAPTPPPVQPSPPPINLNAERASIRRLLDAYVEAYESLDNRRIRAIDPTHDGIDSRLRPLLASVNLNVSEPVIDIAADGRTATLRVDQTFQWKFVRRSPFPDETSRPLTWRLEKKGSDWHVTP